MIKYRLKLGADSYVGGMRYAGRYGKTKSPAMAIVFDDSKEADAAALQYGAWVEAFDLTPLPTPSKGM